MEEIYPGNKIEIVMPEPEKDHIWPVRAAPASLIIVFFNLYFNAAQQIEQMARAGIRQWGRIWHSWETRLDDKKRRLAIVRVHDTGPGIHFDDWERVFEPGYSTKIDGTGLGLYICRNLLSQIRERGLSANLAVTRSILWGGTTFTVTVPLNSNTEAE
jgi:signal transduction histidine kinase